MYVLYMYKYEGGPSTDAPTIHSRIPRTRQAGVFDIPSFCARAVFMFPILHLYDINLCLFCRFGGRGGRREISHLASCSI